MTISEFNLIAESGDIDEFIRVCEARQVKDLSRIADAIVANPRLRLVQIAGASSAGKTTTAKRLATQLRVNGAVALHLSTDDYFVGDERNPRDENGELDYEHVECVDIPRLSADIMKLLEGKRIHRRRFDFIKHDGFDEAAEISLPTGGFVVLEGIHALNPRLTEGIEDSFKYRVFVEPKPKLELFLASCMSSADARLLRRLVRDNQFRKLAPSDTFRLWPKVLAGEKRWIEPFRGNADVTFDSALIYELAVLKPYVEGLLELCVAKDPANEKAGMLLKILRAILTVSPNAVPGDSILRETIGGSQLEY